MRMKRDPVRRLRYFIEALAVRTAVAASSRLTPEQASGLGGWLFRVCGPLLPTSRRIDENLRLALPELDRAERRAMARRVFDNVGRTFFEYPHLEALTDLTRGYVEDVSLEDALGIIVGDGSKNRLQGPLIFISGHCANWELLPLFANRSMGLDLLTVFREPNNPRVARILGRLRDVAGARRTGKGQDTSRTLLRELRNGGSVGFLVDQKLDDGIKVKFFSLPAMTMDAGIRMALRFSCRVVPVHVERISGCRFRIVFDKPLDLAGCDSDKATVAALVQEVNDMIEGWVRARPDQWLWLHRRWPKEVYDRLRNEDRAQDGTATS